jgi:hypothetical protein
MRHQRLLRLGLLPSAGIVLLIGILAWDRAAPKAQADPDEVVFSPRPTREEVEAQFAHIGGPMAIFADEEDGAPAEEPNIHGPYRILPSAFVGRLPVDQRLPLPPDIGTMTNDPGVLERSSLFIRVKEATRAGLKRVTFDSHDGPSEIVVRQVFASSDGQTTLEVTRRRVRQLPIDFLAPPANGALALHLGAIDGTPAIILRRPELSPVPTPLTVAMWVHDGVETIVIGDGLPEETVLAVALGVHLEASK